MTDDKLRTSVKLEKISAMMRRDTTHPSAATRDSFGCSNGTEADRIGGCESGRLGAVAPEAFTDRR